MSEPTRGSFPPICGDCGQPLRSHGLCADCDRAEIGQRVLAFPAMREALADLLAAQSRDDVMLEAFPEQIGLRTCAIRKARAALQLAEGDQD